MLEKGWATFKFGYASVEKGGKTELSLSYVPPRFSMPSWILQVQSYLGLVDDWLPYKVKLEAYVIALFGSDAHLCPIGSLSLLKRNLDQTQDQYNITLHLS